MFFDTTASFSQSSSFRGREVTLLKELSISFECQFYNHLTPSGVKDPTAWSQSLYPLCCTSSLDRSPCLRA